MARPFKFQWTKFNKKSGSIQYRTYQKYFRADNIKKQINKQVSTGNDT